MDYFKVVVENILPVAIAILTPVLVLLARRFIMFLEEKWNFDMTEVNEAKLYDLIGRAVAFAEEKGLAASETGDDVSSGVKKLDSALKFAVGEIERLGLDELATEKLSELIESMLFRMRLDGEVASARIDAESD